VADAVVALAGMVDPCFERLLLVLDGDIAPLAAPGSCLDGIAFFALTGLPELVSDGSGHDVAADNRIDSRHFFQESLVQAASGGSRIHLRLPEPVVFFGRVVLRGHGANKTAWLE
jgi:hypothetical protein